LSLPLLLRRLTVLPLPLLLLRLPILLGRLLGRLSVLALRSTTGWSASAGACTCTCTGVGLGGCELGCESHVYR
jgi:hypothetical protein